MNNSQEDGVYTRTQAFNFLKGLLGVKKNILISKRFFSLFFIGIEEGMYSIKSTEDTIKSIFTKEGIAELNKIYFQKIQAKETKEANEIREQVILVVQKDLIA